jgi:hypothetical protein
MAKLSYLQDPMSDRIHTDFPVSRKTNLESETLENISVEVHINKNE